MRFALLYARFEIMCSTELSNLHAVRNQFHIFAFSPFVRFTRACFHFLNTSFVRFTYYQQCRISFSCYAWNYLSSSPGGRKSIDNNLQLVFYNFQSYICNFLYVFPFSLFIICFVSIYIFIFFCLRILNSKNQN